MKASTRPAPGCALKTQGNWEEQAPMSDLPTGGLYMRQMIGLGGMGRRPSKPPK